MKLPVVVILSVLSVTIPSFCQQAPTCNPANCDSDSCQCSRIVNPITDPDDPAPQLVAITVNEAIVQTLYDDYLSKLFFERKNPDGSPIGITYFVPHEYTDYSLVQDLYVRGNEIGDLSVTKNQDQEYWRNATLDILVAEFGDQKKILQNFAGIPDTDIQGVRTPQLQLQGDVSIDAYIQAQLGYDNSWPTLSSDRLLPYTLDYESTQPCLVVADCPKEAHDGFWMAPITDIAGAGGVECNSLATCLVPGTADEIGTWLFNEVDKVRKDNRAPLSLRLDSYWFSQTANSFEGFQRFLDLVGRETDIFLVPVIEIIYWRMNPVPLSQFARPDYSDREADCLAVNCHLYRADDPTIERYMKSCAPCPEVYPWLGNPNGDGS